MADCATSFDPLCTNAGSANKLEVEREASLFEHPSIVDNVIAYLGGTIGPHLLGLTPNYLQICNQAPIWFKRKGELLPEMLSLGSCSKYLNGVCESDCTWKLLYKRRWGRLATGESSEDAQTPPDNKKGWKLAYIARQKEWFAKISEVLLVVEQRIQNDCMSTDVFHSGINQLKALDITYDDIYSFFFSKKLNVVFTMLGLYYAFFFFRIPAKDLKKAMTTRGVIDKVVCARWTIPRTCRYGFYMPEESSMRVYSLGLVVENQMSVLCLIRQSDKVPRDHLLQDPGAIELHCTS